MKLSRVVAAMCMSLLSGEALAQTAVGDAQAVSSPGAPSTIGSGEIYSPEWLRKPDGEDIARIWPRKAVLARQRAGDATMSCRVAKTGLLENCVVVDETPAGFDFGLAALKLQRHFKLSATTKDGRSTEGGSIRIPVHFSYGF
jgi:protein TonB